MAGSVRHRSTASTWATGGGDAPRRVKANRRIVADALGGGFLVRAHQVHGHAVQVIRSADDPGRPARADALVTDVPGRLLMIQVADCQPVLIYDPQHRVVAAVHAGWRGSVANVIGATVALMERRFASRRRACGRPSDRHWGLAAASLSTIATRSRKRCGRFGSGGIISISGR